MTQKEFIEDNIPDYRESYEDEQAELCEEGFRDGAEWAFNHPTEEVIKKVFKLENDWFNSGKGGDSIEYIIKNWN